MRSRLCLLWMAPLLSACGGGSDDDTRSNSQQASAAESPKNAEAVGPRPDRKAKAVADSCGWSVGRGRDFSESQIRKTFFDATGGAPVGLLLESPLVRPGQQFAVSIWNRAEEDVFHGVANHIERADTDEVVEIKGPYGTQLTPLIGLIVEPGAAGPCVTVSVPSEAEPGSYRVVLDGVEGDGEVSANFEVAGEPLKNVHWEERLEAAARQNRSSGP